MNFLPALVVLAESPAGGDVPQANPLGMFLPMILILGVFYFMMIMPERKKQKKLKKMISELQVGDKIVTIGGIEGKILTIKDEALIVESGNGNDKGRLKVARWAVKEVLTVHE